MQKMQEFCFYRGIMWLLNSYKVTITDEVKNCQEKIEYVKKPNMLENYSRTFKFYLCAYPRVL
jgi:hypothetical protein